MDSDDNSDSGKEEEDDDDDGNKAQLNQMMDQQKKYLQMCQTSAKILQVLTGLGAPQSAHIIELESVSDETDVSSCSSPESLSQSPHTEDTSRPESERSPECVIWAEPLLTCQLVTPVTRTCGDVRRLPPGVTPEDVKRSKAEAARMRAAAAASDNPTSTSTGDKNSQVKAGQSCSTPKPNVDDEQAKTCSAPGATRSKPDLGSSTSATGNSSTYATLDSRVQPATSTSSGTAGADNNLMSTLPSAAAVSSSIAATREDFKKAMSQISCASETIRQAHSLLTSMGLGHYSLRRRLAQVNNNNNPETADETEESARGYQGTSLTPVRASHTGSKTPGVGGKQSEEATSNKSPASKESACQAGGETAESIPTFPPLLMVKPINIAEENRNEMLEKQNEPVDAVESKCTPRPDDLKKQEDPGLSEISKPSVCDAPKLSAETSNRSSSMSDGLCDTFSTSNINRSANVRHFRDICSNTDSWTKWSSHLQPQRQQAMSQTSRVTRFTNRFSGRSTFSRNTPLLSRTQESTNLASTAQNGTTISPVNEPKKANSNYCNHSVDTFSAPSGSISDVMCQSPKREGTRNKDATGPSHNKHQNGPKHKITLKDVKKAVDFALGISQKSGRWTESWNSGSKSATERNLDVNSGGETHAKTIVEDCSTIAVEMTAGGEVEIEEKVKSVEGVASKRVTFLQEPAVISDNLTQVLDIIASVSGDTFCDSENSLDSETKQDSSSDPNARFERLEPTLQNCAENDAACDTMVEGQNLPSESNCGAPSYNKEIGNCSKAKPVTRSSPRELTNLAQGSGRDGQGDAQGNRFGQRKQTYFDRLKQMCNNQSLVKANTDVRNENSNVVSEAKDASALQVSEETREETTRHSPLCVENGNMTLDYDGQRDQWVVSMYSDVNSISNGAGGEENENSTDFKLSKISDIAHGKTSTGFYQCLETELHNSASGSVLQTDSSAEADATYTCSSSTVDHVLVLMDDEEQRLYGQQVKELNTSPELLEAGDQGFVDKGGMGMEKMEGKEVYDLKNDTVVDRKTISAEKESEPPHCSCDNFADPDCNTEIDSESITFSKEEPLYKPSFYVVPSNTDQGDPPTVSSSVERALVTGIWEHSLSLHRSLSAGDMHHPSVLEKDVPYNRHGTRFTSAPPRSGSNQTDSTSDAFGKKSRRISADKYLRINPSYPKHRSNSAAAAHLRLYQTGDDFNLTKTCCTPLILDLAHLRSAKSCGNSPRNRKLPLDLEWSKCAKPTATEDVSPAQSSSVSVIEMMEEKKPEPLIIPGPSLSLDPFGIREGNKISVSDKVDADYPDVQPKVKFAGGSSSTDSDDDSGLEESFGKGATSWFFRRPRRMRLRRRRRRRRQRSASWWARSVRCVRSKLRSFFGVCFK